MQRAFVVRAGLTVQQFIDSWQIDKSPARKQLRGSIPWFEKLGLSRPVKSGAAQLGLLYKESK